MGGWNYYPRETNLHCTVSRLAILLLLITAGGCDAQSTLPPAVTEPSGLCFSADGGGLYTVSDATNQVFLLSLTGEVLNTQDYTGSDLEGVVFDPSNSSLLVVEERTRENDRLTLSGDELSRHAVDKPEGVAIAADGRIYVVSDANCRFHVFEVDS